ncbi:RNHCP domain-containing protein [Martelella radicis]|uniref:RNHCP domain-containing protein n=1 Tax=Martelella radicis TaxID=1397476 RepID=A0A7W6KMI2_9HYPH|nr:RNHCP domain-containing protein [Martelella radicis]MBB4122543.1 hypothetical protein [Martelella radicis]
MRYDDDYDGRNSFRTGHKRDKHKNNRWHAADSAFRCAHCRQMVFPTPEMGTVHRNHCPHCLHSLHVDTKPGNRASDCHARMAPVGLTWKKNGFDKYGRERLGDVMLVHTCLGCGMVNINRIAADDDCDEILAIFERSLAMDGKRWKCIEATGIDLLTAEDAGLLHRSLFGMELSR